MRNYSCLLQLCHVHSYFSMSTPTFPCLLRRRRSLFSFCRASTQGWMAVRNLHLSMQQGALQNTLKKGGQNQPMSAQMMIPIAMNKRTPLCFRVFQFFNFFFHFIYQLLFGWQIQLVFTSYDGVVVFWQGNFYHCIIFIGA